MTTTPNQPQQARVPRSAVRHAQPEELTVLTRANHDMRSPLSVILGVFELLEDTGRLTDNERRYVKLGMKAADELLSLADMLRLYSALARKLVTVETVPVDMGAMAHEQLDAILHAKGTSPYSLAGPPAPLHVQGDAGYLKVALAHLLRHLAARLPEPEGPAGAMLTVCQRSDDQGTVKLQVAIRDQPPSAAAGDVTPDHEDDLGVLVGIRLVEVMGGDATIGPQPSLVLSLPVAAATTR